MTKSPLRYPGGKSRAIEQIAKLIPQFNEYREPFVGGGSVFVYLKQQFSNKIYWLNDLYTDLYTFWTMSQINIDALIRQVYEWKTKYPVGKELFQFLNSNMRTFSDMERAAAFFIYNRITFSGTTLSGGYSEAAFKGRFTESNIRRLKDFATVLNDVLITNYDYENVIKQDGNNVFIFLDPPYYSATKSALYGKNGNLHKTFDYKRFANNMKVCKHKWLITLDDSEYIRDLFSFANIKAWNLTYGMRNITKHSNQKGNELFISNYEIATEQTKTYFRPTLFSTAPMVAKER